MDTLNSFLEFLTLMVLTFVLSQCFIVKLFLPELITTYLR